MKKSNIIHITEYDYIVANRKASREEEIAAHGKQIFFRSHIHQSKKAYSRKKTRKAIIKLDDGFSICISSVHGPIKKSHTSDAR